MERDPDREAAHGGAGRAGKPPLGAVERSPDREAARARAARGEPGKPVVATILLSSKPAVTAGQRDLGP